ncbi:MAG: histidinol dehydrogenase [Treponema sp.]|nr:histidinol dehydrogenase [Treponema sp.]
MIQIQNASDVEDSFFAPRDFTGSSELVRAVLDDVKARGDDALREYGEKFDGMRTESFLICERELARAAEKLQRENERVYDALVYSRDLALRFALKQKESFTDFEVELERGLFTGQKIIPVSRAGVYVPAGRFPLVSTVVMTATPAVAAGVQEIVLCTPPRVHPDDVQRNAGGASCADAACGTNRANSTTTGNAVAGSATAVTMRNNADSVSGKPYADEMILAAAHICGVKNVYAVGGAQAIAAMAFGTQTIPACDVIVGPGNKFVAAAKKEVYGTVGIDMIAGPTEVFIIADSSANPAWLAADLLAQAEHDVEAQPVLATPDKQLAQHVAAEIEKQLALLPTRKTAEASIETCGRIIITESFEQAAELANRKAPEHLELAMERGSAREKIVSLVHNYGSLFVGHYAAEVLGDYAAGLNHTLPTSGSARFTGGLSVRCFLKTVTTLRAEKDADGLKKSAAASAHLGDAEGLAAHANAARLRMQ